VNGGRKVISLKAKNVVEEHDEKIVITYDFQQNRMFIEPFMLVAAFFALFVSCSILSRASGLSTTATSAEEIASTN
jgi:hypothetical protein